MQSRISKKAGLVGRLSFFALLALLGFASPESAHAQQEQQNQQVAGGNQGPSKHTVGISLSQNILFGEWGTRFNDAIGFGLMYSYEATPVFGFVMNLGLSSHDAASADATVPASEDDSLSIKSIEPGIRVNFAYFDSLVLYGMGGFGLYPISQTVQGVDGGSLNFGMNVGFGVDLRINNTFTFGPGLAFRSIFSKTDADARPAAFPAGMNIGGEMMRLFVQAGYMF